MWDWRNAATRAPARAPGLAHSRGFYCVTSTFNNISRTFQSTHITTVAGSWRNYLMHMDDIPEFRLKYQALKDFHVRGFIITDSGVLLIHQDLLMYPSRSGVTRGCLGGRSAHPEGYLGDIFANRGKFVQNRGKFEGKIFWVYLFGLCNCKIKFDARPPRTEIWLYASALPNQIREWYIILCPEIRGWTFV